MIRSFKDRRTAAIFAGSFTKGVPADLALRARSKLRLIDAARLIEDLRLPPGNHLETLKGCRAGQHSIRVNDQWRLCFRWSNGDAMEVELVDYHG